MRKFLTVRQAASAGILPEYRIRKLIAEGHCPGIRAGNRFLINVEALIKMLDRESIQNVGDGANGRK